MTQLSDDELSVLRADVESTFGDLCNTYRVTFSSGTYSDGEQRFLTGTFNQPCGIYFTGGREIRRGQLVLTDCDVKMRLPYDFVIDINDRIDLVSKAGFSISGSYNLMTEPLELSGEKLLYLKKVST